MTVIRKRTGDKGGCCNPYSELQLEIERVDQTAIDAKTIANNAEATVNANMGKINDAIAIAPQVETNTANISQHENRINTNTTNINKNTIDIQEQDKDITALKTKTIQNENRINTNTTNINKNTTDIQKQGEDIVALKTKTNENENRINTNTTNINKNTTDIQKQGEDIVALKTKTNDNSAAIKVLEDEVGPETVAGTIQYRLKNIDTKLPTAIKEVEMVADASTVTHKATHISGTAESDALPVVSRTQAGIMSASVYAAMEDVIANNTSRISVLEQSALTYDISGLVSADPTNAEISAAFQQKYPNIPIQPGIRVADYNNAHFWQYGNNMWILLTQINIQTATNDSLGIVKGSNTDGKVFVETDGSMSLKGYDALVSKDATHDSKINTLEVGLGNANARIDATNTNVANNAADIVAANNEIATNTNDINGLKGRMATAEEQIATHDTKINQHTQSINGLTTDVNGLESRMSTAEGQISTNETNINQHTQSINGLSTDVNDLKSRMSTAEGQISTNETNINQHTQSINGLSTDVNGLKTSKQDKLIAGNGISIAGDGKTISASGAWIIHDHANTDDIFTVSITDSQHPVYLNILKDLKFCVYNIFGPKSLSTSANRPPSIEYLEFNLPKGNYAIQCYSLIGITFLYQDAPSPQQTSSTYQSYIGVSSTGEVSLNLKFRYKRDSDKQIVTTEKQLFITPKENMQHRVYQLPDIINNYNMAKAVGIKNYDYPDKEIISALLIKYQN